MARKYADSRGRLALGPGDYGWNPRAEQWEVRPPVAGTHLLGGLKYHDVTEHDDGTITVFPSILMTIEYGEGEQVRWHGYLERGQWREC